jgi:DNA-binding NarL/FixJ family response regulator
MTAESPGQIYNVAVLLASEDAASRQQWQDTIGETLTHSTVSNLTILKDVLSGYQPPLLLLDRLMLESNYLPQVVELNQLSPTTRILLMYHGDDNDVRVEALKNGVRGFCNLQNATNDLILKAIHTVTNNEVWLPRKMIPQIIDELAINGSPPPALDKRQREALGSLTPRQRDVIRMVCDGANNKNIADQLDISERTVKTHLSTIFTKLGVQSRLHLALLFKEVEL